MNADRQAGDVNAGGQGVGIEDHGMLTGGARFIEHSRHVTAEQIKQHQFDMARLIQVKPEFGRGIEWIRIVRKAKG